MKTLRFLPLLALVIGFSANSCMGMINNVINKVGDVVEKKGVSAINNIGDALGAQGSKIIEKAKEVGKNLGNVATVVKKEAKDWSIGFLVFCAIAVAILIGSLLLTAIILVAAIIILCGGTVAAVLGTVFFFRWLKKRFEISQIVEKTSLKSFSLGTCIKGTFALVKKLFTAKKPVDIQAWQRFLIYPKETLKELIPMVCKVAVAKHTGNCLPVVGLFGTPGVGKTAFMQVFTDETMLDMEYIHIYGSAIRKNPNVGEAINQVRSAIDRSMLSKKRVVFIIDEADGILVPCDEFAINFMSFFKTILEDKNIRKHILFVYTTNTKNLDTAILSRTDHKIEVLQPGESELKQLLALYLNKHIVENGNDDIAALNALGNNKQIVLKIDQRVLTSDFLDKMAKLLKQANASGRTVDQICHNLRMETIASPNTTLMPEMIEDAVNKCVKNKDYFEKQETTKVPNKQPQQMFFMPVMMQPGQQPMYMQAPIAAQ